MTQFQTEQENFWAGDFGDEYINRNNSAENISGSVGFFHDVFKKISTAEVNSLIEFGANVGINLIAIKKLIPNVKMSAIEINDKAVEQLKINVPDVEVYHQSILDFKPSQLNDLVVIKGVLIHINPDKLQHIYNLLYQASKKYICVAEYYNPTPVVIEYRGHGNKLFKRDFAGEMMDKFPDLKLIDYGFKYHRDDSCQGDMNWFLLKKC